jgi:hypothetical protein
MLQRLFPPLAGVSEGGSYTDQEPATARDAENVLTPEPSSGRMRLSKRPGLVKFTSPSTQLGTAKVRDLSQLVVNDLTTDYAAQTPAEEWVATASTREGGAITKCSPRGDVFVLESIHGDTVSRLNADGQLVSQIPLDNDENVGAGPFFRNLALGNDDSFFVAIGDTVTGATGSWIRILRYALGADGEYYRAWKITSGDDAPNDALLVKAMCVKKNRLYTIQQAGGGGATALRLRVYGQIYSNTVPKKVVDYTFLASAVGNDGRGIDVDDAGNVFVSYVTAAPNQFLAKISANSTTIWTIDSVALGRGGLGNDVKVRDGKIWTLGYPQGANQQWLSMYTDGLTAPTHVWSKTDAQAESKDFVTMVVDKFLNVHAPFPIATKLGGQDDLYGHDVAGTELYSFEAPVAFPVRSIAIPAANPNFSNSAASPERPELIYFSPQSANYYAYRLISATPSSGSPRSFVYIGVVDDDVKTFTAAAVATPTGGSAAVDTASTYVQSVTMLGKWYAADGAKYLVYDPEEGEISELLSSTSGLIPKRCALIESWRSRLILAGDRDNRHALYMSAQGDATDWDFFPPTPNSKQAIYTALMPQGDELPDIINCLVPYSNDWLLIGCDRSIWLMRGDPAAGGTLDLITNQSGMAWGRPYCFGPDGELYYFASQGGVYVMAPGLSTPQALSEGKLPRQLADVDLSDYYPRLVWVPRLQGLLLTFCPYGAGGTSIRSWFFSGKTGAWWPWRFGTTAQTGVQPTAVFASDDDDPGGRTILIGGEDSYVRTIDESIAYDELAAGTQLGIGSYVLFGPYTSEDKTRRLQVRELWATMSGSGQAVFQVYSQARPDAQLLTPAQNGVLPPGFSAKIPIRVKGTHIYLKVMDYAAAMPWAIESLSMEATVAGKERIAL